MRGVCFNLPIKIVDPGIRRFILQYPWILRLAGLGGIDMLVLGRSGGGGGRGGYLQSPNY